MIEVTYGEQQRRDMGGFRRHRSAKSVSKPEILISFTKLGR